MTLMRSKRFVSTVLVALFSLHTALAGPGVSICGAACRSTGRQTAGSKHRQLMGRSCCRRSQRRSYCCTADCVNAGRNNACCCQQRPLTQIGLVTCHCQSRTPMPAVPSPNRTPRSDWNRLTLFRTPALSAIVVLGANGFRNRGLSVELTGPAHAAQARLCIWLT